MDERFLKALGAACRATYIPNSSLVDRTKLEQWANVCLELCYGSGEYELDFDTAALKSASLELLYVSRMERSKKEFSDIVAACNTVVRQLRDICEAAAPDYAIYLDSRVKLGTL